MRVFIAWVSTLLLLIQLSIWVISGYGALMNQNYSWVGTSHPSFLWGCVHACVGVWWGVGFVFVTNADFLKSSCQNTLSTGIAGVSHHSQLKLNGCHFLFSLQYLRLNPGASCMLRECFASGAIPLALAHKPFFSAKSQGTPGKLRLCLALGLSTMDPEVPWTQLNIHHLLCVCGDNGPSNLNHPGGMPWYLTAISITTPLRPRRIRASSNTHPPLLYPLERSLVRPFGPFLIKASLAFLLMYSHSLYVLDLSSLVDACIAKFLFQSGLFWI